MHLYLHIPFCRKRCLYCDYISYAGIEHKIELYIQAMIQEMALLPSSDSLYVSPILRPTIFIGGGTPSLLSLHQIEQLLEHAYRVVPAQGAEVSLEINPGTMMGTTYKPMDAWEYLCEVQRLGVNRLSIGVQSLHDLVLKLTGRIHTAEEAHHCFTLARKAGFENIGIDMIAGLPEQNIDMWNKDMNTLMCWQPDHISIYTLILEPRSPLSTQIAAGRLQLPDDDVTATMYEQAMEKLACAGYSQYEISNWSRDPSVGLRNGKPAIPDYACDHNLAYWYNDDYLAVGSGAQGHIYPERYTNVQKVDEYIALVKKQQRPIESVIPLTEQDLFNETMFMGLRLNDGVRFDHFRRRCGTDIYPLYQDTLQHLQNQGLIMRDEYGIRLTHRGRMFGNRVFEQFA